MILSRAQQVIAAKLFQGTDQQSVLSSVIHQNEKTVSIGRFFERNRVVKINDDQGEIDINVEKLTKICQQNGIIDENNQLTEYGQELIDDTVNESVLLRVLRYASS
jgi:hypothetical protein